MNYYPPRPLKRSSEIGFVLGSILKRFAGKEYFRCSPSGIWVWSGLSIPQWDCLADHDYLALEEEDLVSLWYYCFRGCKSYMREKSLHVLGVLYPVIHFWVPYITSDLGPFFSQYITFESNIQAFWSRYITFESNIRALWSLYITSKVYTGSKLDPVYYFKSI